MIWNLSRKGRRKTLRYLTKYGAARTVVNGKAYDSRKEADRATELYLLQRSGEIRNLREQVTFELLPVQHGWYRSERPVKYIADFVYEENTGTGWQQVVEDVKGYRTKDYIIKRKLMLYQHGISIREV